MSSNKSVGRLGDWGSAAAAKGSLVVGKKKSSSDVKCIVKGVL